MINGFKAFDILLYMEDVAYLPTKAHASDAGFDLRAREFLLMDDYNLHQDAASIASTTGSIFLDPSQRVLVKTGVCIALEPGWEAQIRPRSGLALKHGLTVVNAP